MNRYEFEDLISDYIENSLTVQKRKEFENYLTEDPDAKSLVFQVRSTMDQLNNIEQVKVSDHFNQRLMTRIKNEKLTQVLKSDKDQIRFLGFTPAYGSLMTGLIIAFLFVSIKLFFPDKGSSYTQNQVYVNDSAPALSESITVPLNQQTQDLVEVEEDSLIEKFPNSPKTDYTKRIKLVND